MKINQLVSTTFAILLLSGCSHHHNNLNTDTTRHPLQESFAYERAASIAQILPVKLGRFVLEKSIARQSTVYLTLRVANVDYANKYALRNELESIAKGFCFNKKTTLVISQGVHYHLSIINERQLKLISALISEDRCVSEDFIILSHEKGPEISGMD